MFHTAIWDLLAGGASVDEIKSAIELLDVDFVDEVKKEYDEMNEEDSATADMV
jgi:hypothetical protein